MIAASRRVMCGPASIDPDMEAAPLRRFAVITSQIGAATSEDGASVVRSTAGVLTVDGEVLYSLPVPERLTASGEWLVHRSSVSPDRLLSHFPAPKEHVATLYDNFEASCSTTPDAPYLGTRERGHEGKPGRYTWITYAQAAEARTAAGSGLLYHGLGVGSKVGLYSVNCRGKHALSSTSDWVLMDAACHAYSMVSVPLDQVKVCRYDTLGPDAVAFICQHADLAAVACSSDVLGKLLEGLQDNVRLVVVYGWGRDQVLPPAPQGCTATIITLEELQRLGRRHPKSHVAPAPHDMALLCYTSGTTGTPKGAMLTHHNLIAFAVGHMSLDSTRLHADDVHISYLPLAHIYERGTLTSITTAGGSIGFYRGDILELLDDIQELRPTVFYSVPRLYNRIYDRVMATIRAGNPVARRLFETAYAYKKTALHKGDLSGGRLGPFWDRLVFSKVKARLGGRVRLMISGASPLGTDVMDFLRICFSAPMIEGYGLTESASCCSGTLPEETRPGHVGGPMACVEIKLADIPDMKYTNADRPHPRGEVCLRGHTVFKGYYKDDKSTGEAFDEDGWFHTGDVGMWLSGGRLKLIDRKKAMFKLAQGEYVAAEKVENVHLRSPLVAQSFVYGDSLRSKLVAVVVPDSETLLPWAAARDLPRDMAALCAHPAVNAAVLRSVLDEGRAADLRGFEQVAAIHLHPEPFTVENGLQTPTFKLKRPQAKEKFLGAIDEMYSRLPAE